MSNIQGLHLIQGNVLAYNIVKITLVSLLTLLMQWE